MKEKPLTYTIYNCHCHLFTMDYIPEYFISPFVSTSIARNKWVARLGYFLAPKTINRFSAFFYSGLKNSQEDIFIELNGYYPAKTRFCPLTIDFEFMNAGKCRYSFLNQLKDLAILKNKFLYNGEQRLFPFIGIDPRRPKLLDLVKHYIEDEGFTGLKLYPSLGFFPDDPGLEDVYAYAEKNQIPITTHCIPKNKNHFRYKPTKEMVLKASLVPGHDPKEFKRAFDFAKYLNHPYWYEILLEKFPLLKINLGHFGGNEEWDRYLDEPNESHDYRHNWYSYIRNLIEKNQNVYADISFTVYDKSLYPLLKNITNSILTKNKVLFGSDFYMLQKDYKERRFGLDVRGYLTDDEYWRIAETNPRKFLSTAFKEL